MNYSDTKLFQEVVITTADNILESISKDLTTSDIHPYWELIDNEFGFRALINKLFIGNYESYKIEEVQFDEFIPPKNRKEFLEGLTIKSLRFKLSFMGSNFGISVSTKKQILDTSFYKYDTRYEILGSINRFGNYQDNPEDYDIRIFPTTISRNQYNVTFLDDLYGCLSTIEYINLHKFDFPKNYNDWNDSHYMIQRLAF